MKLSVVTITYNNFEELIKTLDSTKDIPNIENVIINGGSCQKTKQYLEQKQFNSITENDNGISDAFNKGIRRATGDAISFLNSGDILVDKKYYKEAIKIFQENLATDFVYANILFKHQIYGDLLVKPSNHPGKIPFPHPGLIIRKVACDRIGEFDSSYKVAMDFDYMCRIKKLHLSGHYYQSAVVVMDGSGVSSSDGKIGLEERERALKKYNLMNLESHIYFNNLKVKSLARNVLQALNLLATYDQLKAKFFKIKSE
jgi:glycosyltransferase involved in cell wall biosynthesis